MILVSVYDKQITITNEANGLYIAHINMNFDADTYAYKCNF